MCFSKRKERGLDSIKTTIPEESFIYGEFSPENPK